MSAAASPLLKVTNLSIAYTSRGETRQVLTDASLGIHPGETIALVGGSGSGKTTLSHALIGLLPRNGRVLGGSIQFRERELVAAPEQAWRQLRGAQISLVPQDPGVSLNPTASIGAQVAEVLLAHGQYTRRQAQVRTLELLESVGLDRPAHRARQYPHELSGGMRQRVLIAIALACTPSLVIADEATSALDVTVQRQILDLFTTVTRRAGVAALLVTHDLGVAADRADRIVVMHNGRIVEQGTTAQIMSAPTTPETRALIETAPSINDARLSARPSLTPAVANEHTAPLLQLQNIHRRFGLRAGIGQRQFVNAVSDVSLEVHRNSTLAVVGESGSGKSTLARTAARLETADSGVIRFDGADITRSRGHVLRALRGDIQMVYQNPYASLSPRLSVEEIIAEPLQAFGWAPSERQTRVSWLLDQVALPATAKDKRPRELSGGQRQRVAIARALALSPKLLILDEPVSALDVLVQRQILQLLVDLQAELGLGYLFITHDLAVVRQIADTVVVMQSGKVVERGTTDAIFAQPREAYTRELLQAIPGQLRAAG